MTGTTDRPSIGVVGNLCNLGYEFVRGFDGLGVHTRLITPLSDLKEWRRAQPGTDPARDAALQIVPEGKFRSQLGILRAIRQYDAVLSVCLGGMAVLPWSGRPYVLYATGADLGELAAGLSAYPRDAVRRARRAFKQARLVIHAPIQAHLEMVQSLGLARTLIWRQFVDTAFWGGAAPLVPNDELRVACASNLLWVPKFPGQLLKRNDVLFRGFAEFIRSGGRGRLVFLQRGPDFDASIELIDQLGIREHVECLAGELAPPALREMFGSSHVVADQYGVGYFGLIALEAMAAGRPVIGWANPESLRAAYPEPADIPPLMLAANPEEVSLRLWEMSDPARLKTAGASSQAWARRLHNPQALAQWYLDHVIDAIGP